MVSIGELNTRITLQAEVRTPDSSGGASVAWSDIATTYAQVTPLSASEKWRNGQLLGEQVYRFTIRARTNTSTATRVQWGNTVYNVTAVTLNGTNPRFHDIVAVAGGAV